MAWMTLQDGRNLLHVVAVVLLADLLAASPALAFGILHVVRDGVRDSYVEGDSVVVDVFLDPEPGLRRFSVAVLASDSLIYDGPESSKLELRYLAPAKTYGSTGARPGHILYHAAGKGPTMLYPSPRDPKWFPAQRIASTGFTQVSVAFDTYSGDGSDADPSECIWIASLVFNVHAGGAEPSISLSLRADNSVVETVTGVGPAKDISKQVQENLSAPIVVPLPRSAPASTPVAGPACPCRVADSLRKPRPGGCEGGGSGP
jgi:hypothetical protein